MKLTKFKKRAIITLLLAVLTYVLLRQNSIRPYELPDVVVVNPAGTCALMGYDLIGDRGSVFSSYYFFLFGSTRAFYVIADLRTGKILRDSSRIPIIDGHDGETGNYLGWNSNGSGAQFPSTEDDGPYYEWENVTECEGDIELANLRCYSDNKSEACKKLYTKVEHLMK
jgi:hypothetical protein